MRYKHKYRLLLLSAALALITPSVSAQQLRATRSHFSTEDGLCSNAVSMISQDDLGFIWIATWNGLSRYDGYHFYNYKTGNSSNIKNLHNRILDIVIDQSQNPSRASTAMRNTAPTLPYSSPARERCSSASKAMACSSCRSTVADSRAS